MRVAVVVVAVAGTAAVVAVVAAVAAAAVAYSLHCLQELSHSSFFLLQRFARTRCYLAVISAKTNKLAATSVGSLVITC